MGLRTLTNGDLNGGLFCNVCLHRGPRQRLRCRRRVQKINFNANWIWREVVAVLKIRPTFGLIAPHPVEEVAGSQPERRPLKI